VAEDFSTAQEIIGEFAPKLVSLTDEVLYGDVWERPGLSKRDRSLVTVAALVALYRTEEMAAHMQRAVDNGLTAEELIEAITHLAFYCGWPNARTAILAAKKLFA
jgi:4-carboxymuconolactone decarboxylase